MLEGTCVADVGICCFSKVARYYVNDFTIASDFKFA